MIFFKGDYGKVCEFDVKVVVVFGFESFWVVIG